MASLRFAACAVFVVATSLAPAFASSAASSRSHAQQRQPAPPPGPHMPASRQHVEFVVETNKLGQVTRATKVTRSTDSAFNAMTYGNALQAFIRTPDGKAIAGVYKLSYDYNPANKKVHRTVALVRMGGVNANAPGAVNVEADKVQAEQHQVQAASAEASALPGLHQMTRHHH